MNLGPRVPVSPEFATASVLLDQCHVRAAGLLAGCPEGSRSAGGSPCSQLCGARLCWEHLCLTEPSVGSGIRWVGKPPRSQSHTDTSRSGVVVASIAHRSLGGAVGILGWASGSRGRAAGRARDGTSSHVDGVQRITQRHFLATK